MKKKKKKKKRDNNKNKLLICTIPLWYWGVNDWETDLKSLASM